MLLKYTDYISFKNTWTLKIRGESACPMFLVSQNTKHLWNTLDSRSLPNLKPKHVQVCRSQSVPAESRGWRREERKDGEDAATHCTLH